MVIYLISSERASDAWPELGIVIRQAVAMGLHVDPTQLYPSISLKDAEVRRRLWWTIACLDSFLCYMLGRPAAITHYTTQLPMDIPDDQLTDHTSKSPCSTGLTTTFTYHWAHLALTIPSFDILGRVFPQNRYHGKLGLKGWFPPRDASLAAPFSTIKEVFTYDDAVRFDGDIVAWYHDIPAGMRFDPSIDSGETLIENRPQWQVSQTLSLCVKVNMMRLVLHRSYLQADPTDHRKSTEICFDAAHATLCAFRAMAGAKSSLAWSW